MTRRESRLFNSRNLCFIKESVISQGPRETWCLRLRDCDSRTWLSSSISREFVFLFGNNEALRYAGTGRGNNKSSGTFSYTNALLIDDRTDFPLYSFCLNVM